MVKTYSLPCGPQTLSSSRSSHTSLLIALQTRPTHSHPRASGSLDPWLSGLVFSGEQEGDSAPILHPSYVGRKRMQVERPEKAVPRVRNLVEADYSYWTLAYVLSQQGARKLLAAQPLAKMLPVDEFLPVMFDKHPVSEYKSHFSPRNLHAFSVEPLLVYPTHYTGDDGYVSDTETSVVWDNEHVKTDWDRAKSQKMREQQALSREAKNSDVLQSPLDSAARDEL
uniref:Collagen beta(1-O)galactosyltransferase 1 n=1 Tax=Equus caballus TaxID=9796 RepID=A0A9L0T848_HORSE